LLGHFERGSGWSAYVFYVTDTRLVYASARFSNGFGYNRQL
jgi:hypothetical protein